MGGKIGYRTGLCAVMGVLALGTLASCGKSAPKPDAQSTGAQGADPVAVVEAFDKMVMEHRASEAIMKYVSEDFIEHDPTVKGGNRKGLFDYMVKAGWDEKSKDRKSTRLNSSH